MVYVFAEERETVLMWLGDDRHLGYGDPDVMIGTRVDPFTLVRLIGARAMGGVYVAGHHFRKTQHAVKLLSYHPGEDALLVCRFIDQACDIGHEPMAIMVAPDKIATVERNW